MAWRGNGYAFLKLRRRTGDVRWLARERAFAIARHRAERACLDGEARSPTLDVFRA
jgi:hypothetical protein